MVFQTRLAILAILAVIMLSSGSGQLPQVRLAGRALVIENISRLMVVVLV